ncbi:MAG: TlpA family protein disulfide reductase [Mycobacterium sp.]|nr:TlpA family protein disulfide reductase [Mycobacterium sp.]
MTTSTRWTLAIVAVLAALVAGLALHLIADPPMSGETDSQSARAHREADTDQALAGPRQLAALPPCPAPDDGPGPAKLRGLVVECAADGSAVEVAPALAGRVVLLNLWAYWCGPCAEELPALAKYQQQAGDSVTVVTVHQDENETAGLLRMAELGVRLPMLQDGRRDIAAALSIPNVMPATVVLRPDGSVAAVLPKPFTSADDIAAEVESALR